MASEKYIKQLTIGENTYTIPIPIAVSQLQNDSKYVNETQLADAINELPEPMIFKGSLGTNGTIVNLEAASSENEGFTYKVITAGTYASQNAKVGDTFISDGNTWILIPSGDEPSGTVTSITLTQGTGISITNSGVAITSSGSRTISLATITKNNSTSTASPSHGETFTTIDAITYDNYGRVTGVNTKTVTLPSDSDQKVYQQASTSSTAQPILFRNNVANNTGSSTEGVRYVTTVTVTPSTGNIKATTFNGYTLNNASAKDVDSSISAGSTSTKLPTSEAVAAFVEGKGYITSADIPEGASAYTGTISAVGTAANTGTNNGFARGDHVHNIEKATIDAKLGTGTGTEKFYREDGTWQVPAYLTIGNTATTAAAGNHTHTTTIATSNGTNQLTLNANTKYAITAGGTSYIFTTPTDTNTHRPIQLKGTEILGNNITALNFAQGDNVTLSNSSGTITIAATDTTYESKSAASGGTTVSLVTTGEKYIWNNKQNALTNPVTGTGTTDKLAIWNGTSTITSGPQIFVETTAPTSTDGSNGDIWFTYTE